LEISLYSLGIWGLLKLFVFFRWAFVLDLLLGTCNSLLVCGGLCSSHNTAELSQFIVTNPAPNKNIASGMEAFV